MSELNKFGKCPSCQANWDGGDIYEVLSKTDVYMNKSQDAMIKIAGEYGWTPDNSKRFSNTKIISFESIGTEVILAQCNACLHVFDAMTGEEFETIHKAKEKYLIEA